MRPLLSAPSRIICQTKKCFHGSPPCPSITTSSPLPQLVTSITEQLTEAGISEPELSASYLLSKCLSNNDPGVPVMSRDWTRVPAETCLSPGQLTTLETLVQCRLSHVPIQYLVGNWDFRELTLICRPPIFIPRPETEQLVEVVMSRLPGDNCSLLEVGPGTGAVSLSLLRECEAVSRITAVERSKAALELTHENAEMLGLSDKLKLVPGRVGTDVELDLEERYDLVFSNPPYILRKDLPKLPPQIALFEDLRALDGGAEGLDVILPILELAGNKLLPGGLVILEVDPCHPYLLPEKLEKLQHSFEVVEVVKDFAEKDRFMVLKKQQ